MLNKYYLQAYTALNTFIKTLLWLKKILATVGSGLVWPDQFTRQTLVDFRLYACLTIHTPSNLLVNC